MDQRPNTPDRWSDSPDPSQPDPTQQEPSGVPGTPGGRARRAGRMLLVLLLLAGTIGASAVGWQQRAIAAGWQQRAIVLEQQRDDAIGRSEALSEQLGALGNLVELSVDDLTNLEERLAELAGEKAQAEDGAAVARDELRLLAGRVEAAVRQLDACVEDLIALQSDTIDAYNSAVRGTPVDVGPLNARQTAVSQRCAEARQAAASAVALASRLR